MAETSFDLTQQIFKARHPPIRVDVYHESGLTQSVIKAFLDTTRDGVIGAAPIYGPKCVLKVLALSSVSHVLVIRLSPSKIGSKSEDKKQPTHLGRDLLRDLILCDTTRTKYAFQMDKLATALHFDLGLRINQAVDLLSARKTSTDRHSLAALLEVLGGESALNKAHLSTSFKGEERLGTPTPATAMQAWSAHQAAHLDCMSKRLTSIVRIHTDAIMEQVSPHSRALFFLFSEHFLPILASRCSS